MGSGLGVELGQSHQEQQKEVVSQPLKSPVLVRECRLDCPNRRTTCQVCLPLTYHKTPRCQPCGRVPARSDASCSSMDALTTR